MGEVVTFIVVLVGFVALVLWARTRVEDKDKD